MCMYVHMRAGASQGRRTQISLGLELQVVMSLPTQVL